MRFFSSFRWDLRVVLVGGIKTLLERQNDASVALHHPAMVAPVFGQPVACKRVPPQTQEGPRHRSARRWYPYKVPHLSQPVLRIFCNGLVFSIA